MRMEKRIALTGSYGNGKTLVSLTLSELMGVPRAHVENIDVLYRDIYGVGKNPKFYTMPELFSVGLARFHSRIKQEKQTGFISDGSVLNELAYGEARMRMSSKQTGTLSLRNLLYSNMYKDFGYRLERTIVDYAKTAYDEVYYLKIDPLPSACSQTNLLFQNYFEEALFRLFENNGIKYKCLVGGIESFILAIWDSCNCKTIERVTIQEALNIAVEKKKSLREDFHFGK